MAKEFAKGFYNSKEWQKCRHAYITSVFGLCERCKHEGYILHHKVKLTPNNINDQSVTLNFDNLQYLCTECHNIVHGKQDSDNDRKIMFNSKGQVIGIIDKPPY
jgi:5-methylcytosine-specific restriction protein A